MQQSTSTLCVELQKTGCYVCMYRFKNKQCGQNATQNHQKKVQLLNEFGSQDLNIAHRSGVRYYAGKWKAKKVIINNTHQNGGCGGGMHDEAQTDGFHDWEATGTRRRENMVWERGMTTDLTLSARMMYMLFYTRAETKQIFNSLSIICKQSIHRLL